MATVEKERGRRTAKIAIAEERYNGWLDVQRTISSAFDSYRTECVVDFDGGWVELRRFAWSEPMESVWHTDEHCYFLSLSLEGLTDTDRRNVGMMPALPCGGRRVLLVPPDQTISSMSPAAGERRSMRCLIDADFIESLCPVRPTAEERAQLAAVDLSGGAIEWHLLRMYREISDADVCMTIAVESIAREIAVEIVRTIERRRQVAGRRLGGLPNWRMRLIHDRIYAEGPLPKVNDLAVIAGMTVRHLRRAFLAETGRALGKFIASAMAERASRMLETGVPVGTVAATLGYASSSSFAHAFHRETGTLPSCFRDGHRHRGQTDSAASQALLQSCFPTDGQKLGH